MTLVLCLCSDHKHLPRRDLNLVVIVQQQHETKSQHWKQDKCNIPQYNFLHDNTYGKTSQFLHLVPKVYKVERNEGSSMFSGSPPFTYPFYILPISQTWGRSIVGTPLERDREWRMKCKLNPKKRNRGNKVRGEI